MKTTLISATLFLLFIGCQKHHPTKYAIVYGISKYPYVGLELPYSANDAISISRLLEKQGYSVILRTDSLATLDNLEKDFTTVKKIINEQDIFLFYFSGHGLTKQTLIEHGDSTANDNYFSMLLYHKFIYKNLLQYIQANTLTKDYLNQLVNTIPAGSIKISVIDACYSGKMIANKPVVDYSPDDYDGSSTNDEKTKIIIRDAIQNFRNYKADNSTRGYMCITSCGSNEVSWDGFFSHSVFTYFFIMSAEQGDLNKDGRITALESYSYVFAAFQKYWNIPNGNKEWNFLPKITGGAEDIIIFNRPIIINSGILNN